MRIFSPAKINLFFQVLRKREDGYHEIASLFQAITLGDYLTLHLADKDSFSCTDPTLPQGEENLVHKAIKLFRAKTKLTFAVQVHLEKKIPIEAGLGGGSSNAATTLWGINQLLGDPVSEKDLTLWSSEIGSDVAFFFSTGTAMCRGRGEILENKTLPLSFSAHIVKPHFGIPTPAVFKAIDYSCLTKEDSDSILNQFLSQNPRYFNDLEPVALRIEPRLVAFKENLLKAGFSKVVMTGSGSSYFCFGNSFTPFPEASFFRVESLQRTKGHWYTPFI